MTETPEPRVPQPFFERPPWNCPWAGWALGALVAAIDFATGPEIRFPILFVLPVLLLAWNCGTNSAVGLAVILCGLRGGFDHGWHAAEPAGLTALNALIRGAVLVLLALVTARLAGLTRELDERVAVSESILPICGFCKKIRDEQGAWHQMESYLSKRSQAQFSHGVCAKCAERHYGDVLSPPAPPNPKA